MARCFAKHLLCGMLVSGAAYLAKLTEVDHLLMASLPKQALFACEALAGSPHAVRTSSCPNTADFVVPNSMKSCDQSTDPFCGVFGTGDRFGVWQLSSRAVSMLQSAIPASFGEGIASVACKVAWHVPVRRAKLHRLGVGPNLAGA